MKTQKQNSEEQLKRLEADFINLRAVASQQEQTIKQQKALLDEKRDAVNPLASVVPLQAKKFTYRYSGTIQQYRHFPAIEKLSYDNYLVAINYSPNSSEYQFKLLDGANCGSGGLNRYWTSLQIS
jgi:hypothetical protein